MKRGQGNAGARQTRQFSQAGLQQLAQGRDPRSVAHNAIFVPVSAPAESP